MSKMDPEREVSQVMHWIEKAAECFDDDEFEACDAALGIADSYQKVYMLQMRALEIDMMRERHQVEVVKRARTERRLEAVLKKQPEQDPW